MITELNERVRALFAKDIETKISMVDDLSLRIAQAGQCLVNCLLADGKIFICGQGGSIANCLHFSAAMMNCFEVERPSLPVINLTSELSALISITKEGQDDFIFARQLQALAHDKDVVIVLTTTGQSQSMVNLISAAQAKNLKVIALTGRDGGLVAQKLHADDFELRIASSFSAQIREIHLFILHCFCDVIDRSLFGAEHLLGA